MCDDNITSKRTPLRNSNSANKPFRSPLTLLTPNNNASPNIPSFQSPMRTKSSTPKRSMSQFRLPLKRRRIEDESQEECSVEINTKMISSSDILIIKRRINRKRQELDNLRTRLNYTKKHKSEDLLAQINKWRMACKEALFQFQKILNDKSGENQSMRQILEMLGISMETVKFTQEECDLT